MKRRTPEQWQALFNEHKTSGLTAAEFCRQNNLNAKYFSLRRQQLQTKLSAFVKATMSTDNCSFELIHIRYQNIELHLPLSISSQSLADLIKALACEA